MFGGMRGVDCPCRVPVDDAVDTTPKPVVTLVHGTWARHSWNRHKGVVPGTQPPSQMEDLHDALRRRLPDAEIYRFCWSGGNSNTKRLTAANELRVHLRKLFRRHPNGRHFLVGHSHGGTVSLYAMKDRILCDRMSGIITLATPFLHFNRRKLPRFLLYWNAAVLTVSSLIAAVGLFNVQDGGVVARVVDYPSPWWWLAVVVVVAGIVGVGLVVASALLYRGSEFGPMSLFGLRNEGIIEAELERLQLPKLDTKKLFVVRGLGDEAAGVLASSQFLFSWVVTRLLNLIDFKRLMSAWRSLVSVFLIATFVLNRLQIFGSTDDFFVNLSVVSLFVLALGGGVFAIVGLLILVLGSLPFAWDSGFLGLVAQTSAEPMPAGAVSVFQLGEPTPSGLDHSIQHRVRVHDLIQQWISGKQQESLGIRRQLERLRDG